MTVLLAFVYVHHMQAYFLRRPEEGIRSPGTGVVNGCDLSCGFWELNVGPLQENKHSQPLNHLSIPP